MAYFKHQKSIFSDDCEWVKIVIFVIYEEIFNKLFMRFENEKHVLIFSHSNRVNLIETEFENFVLILKKNKICFENVLEVFKKLFFISLNV